MSSMIKCSILLTLNERAMFIVSSCCRPVASIMYINPTEMVLGRFEGPIISSNLLSFNLAWISICNLFRVQPTCYLLELIQKTYCACNCHLHDFSGICSTIIFNVNLNHNIGIKLFTCLFVEWSNFLRHCKIPRRL